MWSDMNLNEIFLEVEFQLNGNTMAQVSREIFWA